MTNQKAKTRPYFRRSDHHTIRDLGTLGHNDNAIANDIQFLAGRTAGRINAIFIWIMGANDHVFADTDIFQFYGDVGDQVVITAARISLRTLLSGGTDSSMLST